MKIKDQTILHHIPSMLLFLYFLFVKLIKEHWLLYRLLCRIYKSNDVVASRKLKMTCLMCSCRNTALVKIMIKNRGFLHRKSRNPSLLAGAVVRQPKKLYIKNTTHHFQTGHIKTHFHKNIF